MESSLEKELRREWETFAMVLFLYRGCNERVRYSFQLPELPGPAGHARGAAPKKCPSGGPLRGRGAQPPTVKLRVWSLSATVVLYLLDQ